MDPSGPHTKRVQYPIIGLLSSSSSSSSPRAGPTSSSLCKPLDTVRALHQTVVSLRSALDEARQEIDRLKKQIHVQAEVDEGLHYRSIVSTIKNPTNTTQQIDSEYISDDSHDNTNTDIHQEQAYNIVSDTSEINLLDNKQSDTNQSHDKIIINPNVQLTNDNTNNIKNSEVITKCKRITTENKQRHIKISTKTIISPKIKRKRCRNKDKQQYQATLEKRLRDVSEKYEHSPRIALVPPDINIFPYQIDKTETINTTSVQQVNNKRDKKPTMASKIDVKIKVSSNVHVDKSRNGTTTTDTTTSSSSEAGESARSSKDSPRSDKTDETEEELVVKDNDNLDTDEKQNISVISKENLSVAVKGNDESIDIRHTSSDNLHLDNISNASMSEGENSVFAEDVITPVDIKCAPGSSEEQKLHSDSAVQTNTKTTGAHSENHEEVDDIELIFSADGENKEITQEDLVSISDYEPWQKPGGSGTPVLVKFDKLNSERQSSASDTDTGSSRKRSLSKLQSHSLQNKIIGCSDNTTIVCKSTKSTSMDKDSYYEDQENNSFANGVQRDESFDAFESTSTLGRKWTNCNVLIETDISKCGIIEDNILDMGRRNTCPNPVPYRPILHRETAPSLRQAHHTTSRCPHAVKFSRSPRSQPHATCKGGPRPILTESNQSGPKRSSSAQTDISALPAHWRSETHLAGVAYGIGGMCTLPSKFAPPPGTSYHRHPLKLSDKTQEARRVLLSDINFTSMVPELSRSADHLCQDEDGRMAAGSTTMIGDVSGSPSYCKGNLLRTPDYAARGITPSASLTSPGISQWTVNESSLATQTTQTGGGTGEFWTNRGDSFDSCRSYSTGSRYSSELSRHNRSRSVPSVRCVICKQSHGMRTSESMHYAPRVTFQEPQRTVRGSLPDLRHDCTCPRRYGGHYLYRIQGDSSGSTDSLLDEAEDFLRRSMDGILMNDINNSRSIVTASEGHSVGTAKRPNRRCSENDIQRDYTPSKQSLPFLPRSPKCLKPGHLAKVISKTGRVVVGRIRYIGPMAAQAASKITTDKIASSSSVDDNSFVGLQLPNNLGDCDGSIDGRKFFDCEPLHGIFVPFKKVVMAWTG